VRSPTGVIPFIGAGMPHDFGAPMWGDFLELAAVTDEDKGEVKRLVKDDEYEDAAQFLDAGAQERISARSSPNGWTSRWPPSGAGPAPYRFSPSSAMRPTGGIRAASISATRISARISWRCTGH
jgi:hypothetical protein